MPVNSDPQDGVDAAARARRGYSADWHPVLSADEVEPGTWVMRSQVRDYAIIRMLRIGDEVGYRAVTWAERSADRRLVGYYRSLRAACAAAHQVFLAGHARAGGINGQ
ncbi:hypothetical protein [Schumannella sp. 10F1B-5-1]|uniref:hypothetical protein n=1 Tax=Schumannella sp. 10F1B-5-1 TaxID=2590780 RepID=UPI0011323D5A|nr:hypothetical protein [Schumannella sp. 10F1B-5-1]TPW71665.1 hypothetical protein FJ658_09970 [Schumannella sp. 10F1B-5-1]